MGASGVHVDTTAVERVFCVICVEAVLVRRSRRWIFAASVPTRICCGLRGRSAVAGAPRSEGSEPSPVVPGSQDLEITLPVEVNATLRRESVPVEKRTV